MSRRQLADLGLKPLTARSLILSALLGSHPPGLSARALVALGTQFGMAEGTVRVALSRMVASGELEAENGLYMLGTRLRQRQTSQDIALHPSDTPWDGSWWFAIVETPGRALADRRAFRAHMEAHRMGELRPDTWLRPANIPGPTSTAGVLSVRGQLTNRDPAELAARLWDLATIEASARALITLAEDALDRLVTRAPDVLPDTFLVSVALARFLRTEPQLPNDIVGPNWPPDKLRDLYQHLVSEHASLMTTFLATTDTA